MSFSTHILEEANNNSFFRKVLFTGDKSQLVVMDIKPGEDIGEETHTHVEQTLFFLSGNGKAVLNNIESNFKAGDIVVVNPGVKHNFINSGNESLKVITVYAPANHIKDTIHKTKHDADLDIADEDFGNNVK